MNVSLYPQPPRVGDIVILHRQVGAVRAGAHGVVVEVYKSHMGPGVRVVLTDRSDINVDVNEVKYHDHDPNLAEYKLPPLGPYDDARTGIFDSALGPWMK